MGMKKPDYAKLVHSPADLSAAIIQWAEHVEKYTGITWGIPCIDSKVVPMYPGDFTCILGRPGAGKSSLLAFLAKQEARRIVERGTQDKEAVVYVTWESSAEEIASFLMISGKKTGGYSVSDLAWGRVPLEKVRQDALNLVTLPVWTIGHGIGRADQNIVRMTPKVVYHAIETMEAEYGRKPVLMLFDYIQLIPSETAQERVAQVTEAPIRIKELALTLGAPAVAAVQASRKVDTYDTKLPEQNDAQWASSIEQTADKMFSLWRPAVTEGLVRDGQPIFIEFQGKRLQVTNELMLIQMIKQRREQGRHLWAMYFDPAYLWLAEMELRHAADAPIDF